MSKTSSSGLIGWVILGLAFHGLYAACVTWYPELGLPDRAEMFAAVVRLCDVVGNSEWFFVCFVIAAVVGGGMAMFFEHVAKSSAQTDEE